MSSEEYKPFVYTPFFRRFTDERAQDIHETKLLYKNVRARHLASKYSDDAAIKDFALPILLQLDTPLRQDFIEPLFYTIKMEDSIFGFDDVNIEHLSLKEQVELNRYLRAKDYFFAHEERIIETLSDALILVFNHIAEQLPKTLAPSPFVIPLVFALPNPKLLIEELFGELWKEKYKTTGLFVHMTRQLYFNLCEVSGISDPEEPKKSFLMASKNPAQLPTIVHDYLKETPFEDFLNVRLPLQLTHEEMFSHTHILGGSGSGKTQMLQQLILHFLTEEDRPSLVIVDSQGDLIKKIMQLDLPFDPILISPKQNPSLNIFDVSRLSNYGDTIDREQVTAGVIDTFDYLFSELFGLDLTGKQTVFFRMVSRMLISLPETLHRNATMLDMLAVLDDVKPYLAAIDRLPPIPKQFFERDFKGPTFKQTKEQLRYRLQAILENPTLARLFTAEDTEIDLFGELNNGSLILVDTDKEFLKSASPHFGKLFISLIFQAVMERAVIPEKERKDTFLFVDEASQYFSHKMDDLLTEARKYKCGCIFSHQFLEQATPQLRASLAANTAIKMASGLSDRDARSMASDMRTTAEFILGQPKLHFACHIRNVTPQAVSIPVEAGKLEDQPKRDDYDDLMVRNKKLVGSKRNIDIVADSPNEEYPPEPGTGLSED